MYIKSWQEFENFIYKVYIYKHSTWEHLLKHSVEGRNIGHKFDKFKSSPLTQTVKMKRKFSLILNIAHSIKINEAIILVGNGDHSYIYDGCIILCNC